MLGYSWRTFHRNQTSNQQENLKKKNCLEVKKGITMYLASWDEFERAAQNLYLQGPMKVTYSMKYAHKSNLLKIKLTDNEICLQYKTENQPELKKVEKFINNLMRHMASKDHS